MKIKTQRYRFITVWHLLEQQSCIIGENHVFCSLQSGKNGAPKS